MGEPAERPPWRIGDFRGSLRITGKKTPGGAGTHGTHTRDTRAHTGTRITQTNLKTIQTHRHTRTTTRRRGRLKSQHCDSTTDCRRPGADRSPRPTQKRPPPYRPPLPVFGTRYSYSVRFTVVSVPVLQLRHRFKDTGTHTRLQTIRHKNRSPQTNLKTNPTRFPPAPTHAPDHTRTPGRM